MVFNLLYAHILHAKNHRVIDFVTITVHGDKIQRDRAMESLVSPVILHCDSH